ncbi:Fic family protein [Paremcibacter congregatus]|uniref:Fic family protein n=1 Tax=Paremcibacter congregatus TaxID=2043170 RepID=UPI003A8DA951
MTTASEKLAISLEALSELQKKGKVAIRSKELSRTHRERLLQTGFLKLVIKGWYIPARPDEPAGESTSWYASFWDFCANYLSERFAKSWCLSPEQSLQLHTGNRTVPQQLLIRSPKGSRNIISLPHNTSLLDVKASLPPEGALTEQDGLHLYSVPAALVEASPGFYTLNPNEARAALGMIRDASEVLPRLLEGGHSAIAGRLAGAFRNIGKERIASDIIKTMRAAGYTVRELDPFTSPSPFNLIERQPSPYTVRLRLMWQTMRDQIEGQFPPSPGRPNDIDAYLKRVDDAYVSDAYHSLSIEGYRVNPDLIRRVRTGNWNPDANAQDLEHRNALAARGYWQAFQQVKASIRRILEGENPGQLVETTHGDWYRELFGPSVTAGLIKAADLAGYRNGPVYIRQSMHVPPAREALLDLMDTFFELLAHETDAAARVVLGHFAFVYIHPYIDGNGRMGRFLMNAMFAAGGYPWTIVPVEQRATYMAALETASTKQDIRPFAAFLGNLTKTTSNPPAIPI